MESFSSPEVSAPRSKIIPLVVGLLLVIVSILLVAVFWYRPPSKTEEPVSDSSISAEQRAVLERSLAEGSSRELSEEEEANIKRSLMNGDSTPLSPEQNEAISKQISGAN